MNTFETAEAQLNGIVSFTDAVKQVNAFNDPDVFMVNLLLTNKCNLRCSYCYEQHRKNNGVWDIEKIKVVYDRVMDILAERNFSQICEFQFFGGEPLLFKDMILEFKARYYDELKANKDKIQLSLITNGILMTEDFCKEWFKDEWCLMGISLDTLETSVDYRELDNFDTDFILNAIDKWIPQSSKDSNAVTMRTTISQEAIPYLREYFDELYKRGMRTWIIHPLNFDAITGGATQSRMIVWDEEVWAQLQRDIEFFIMEYDDARIIFIEGVGQKYDTNCLTGDQMIAVDAEGDLSGCYFTTNLKGDGGLADSTMLGNILEDKFNLNTYRHFRDEYKNKRKNDPQCKECHLQDRCYTCPVGNAVTFGDPFASTPMCQRITQAYLDIKEYTKNATINKLVKFYSELSAEEYKQRLCWMNTILDGGAGNKLSVVDTDYSEYTIDLDALLAKSDLPDPGLQREIFIPVMVDYTLFSIGK
jgi:uncharacterized protein